MPIRMMTIGAGLPSRGPGTIEEAKWHKGTHDLGFMMYDSFGKAYELTGERSYKDVVLQSAKTLITRYSPKVKSIRSWDHNRDRWKYPVIIDNMMNLEMLFRATQLTGDSIYWNVQCEPCQHYTEESFPSGLLLLSRSGLPPGNR